MKWWQILLAVLALILIIWLLFKFAPVIVYAFGKVVALPFKAISSASKKSKEKRRESKENKESKANKKPPEDTDGGEV